MVFDGMDWMRSREVYTKSPSRNEAGSELRHRVAHDEFIKYPVFLVHTCFHIYNIAFEPIYLLMSFDVTFSRNPVTAQHLCCNSYTHAAIPTANIINIVRLTSL